MDEVKVVKCEKCVYVGEKIIHGMKRMICNNRVIGVVKPDFYCGDGEEAKDDASEES